MTRKVRYWLTTSALALALPLTMGAQGDGCAANSESPAPDIEGEWDITYDDTLGVEIKIGGSVYTQDLGAGGGVVEIDHNGEPFMFDLDCDRPEVLCPSEAWPDTVTVTQTNERFEHRMWVDLPKQICEGELVDPLPDECGPDTTNPECDQVCDGDIGVETRRVFGVIGEAGNTFRLFLGAGLATNGINCALLGYSLADADLVTEGSAEAGDWHSDEMDAGIVTVGYTGGCLWVGGGGEALALGAEVKFTTGFTGGRIR